MKKCALINDLSGFGKCSLGAAIPVISVMGIEAHPLPTAVLSNQTGYESYKAVDLSEYMPSFFAEWQKLNVDFDAVLTGYFTNSAQIDSALDFIKSQNALVVVDPVMGDDGKRYKGFTDEICSKIKALALCADIITPNETELFLLTGESNIEKAARSLMERGIGSVVVTGIKDSAKIGSAVFEKDKSEIFYTKYTDGSYSGTGDLFSAIVTGLALCGRDTFEAVKTAAEFISFVLENSEIEDRNNGIDFEKYLYGLGAYILEKQ